MRNFRIIFIKSKQLPSEALKHKYY